MWTFTEDKADIINYIETSWSLEGKTYDIADVVVKEIAVQNDPNNSIYYVLWAITSDGQTKSATELKHVPATSGSSETLYLEVEFSSITCTSDCQWGCDPAAMVSPTSGKVVVTCAPCSPSGSCKKTTSAKLTKAG